MSLRQGRKVSTLIVERFPATLELSFGAALLALGFGIPMGVYTALKRGNFLAQALMTVSLLGVSLPTFLIGILLILLFAVMLEGAAHLSAAATRWRSARGPAGCSRWTAGST